jgi:hypothetical protein
MLTEQHVEGLEHFTLALQLSSYKHFPLLIHKADIFLTSAERNKSRSVS